MIYKKVMHAARFLVIITFFCMIGINNISAAETVRIAVLDFQANDTSKYAAKAVSEFISTEMAKKTEITVIERKQMGAILNEQGFQQTGCTDQECAVEMGKLLSAKKMLLGTLTKTGKVFVITAKSVDVETGRIDFAESERCGKEEDIELASKILAVKLVNNIASTNYTIPLRTYQVDESRNKFAVGLSYRYGKIFNVKVPAVANEPGNHIISDTTTLTNNSIIVSPGYEFTQNFGMRLDLKFINIQANPDSFLSTFPAQTLECKFDNSYGLGLNAQFIYPVDGLSFYLIPGLGFDRYNIKNPMKYKDHLNYKPLCYKDSSINIYLLKLETGFSVYISRYMELFLSVGADYHVFSKLIEIDNNSKWFEQLNATNNYKSNNLPPEYYAQAGLTLRLF